MASSAAKLTHSTDEVRFSNLLQGERIYSIPYFQRPYKWQAPKLRKLESDVLTIVDEQTDVHFLGAIISYDQPKSNSTQASVIDVIDGQQRLTTVFLYVCAAVRTLIDLGELTEARQLFRKFVVVDADGGPGSNLRLHTSHEDRLALNDVVDDILQRPGFAQTLVGFTFIRLKAAGVADPSAGKAIRKNYAAARRFFKTQHQEGGIERVRQAYEAFLSGLTVVQIVVQDPTTGPQIFDSLNSRQEPMTTGDLIRNDIFARASEHDPALVEDLHQSYWLPFYSKFKVGTKNYFDDYFFPYGLTQDPTVTKSTVYDTLTSSWEGKEPKAVIEALGVFQPHFMDLAAGTSLAGHGEQVAVRIRRLREANAPSSIDPFVMLLSRATADGELPEGKAIELLDLLDCFLTRRQICGIEPTGLHAVFKGLWSEISDDPTAAHAVEAIGKHTTVHWPDDEQVREAVRTRKMYRATIVRYLVREYDRARGGDQHTTIAQIEHVLPQRAKHGQWAAFSKDQHAEMVDRLANLLPLSESMNPTLSNGPYSAKQPVYLADSVFKSTREFAARYADWTPEALLAREADLCSWVVERWPDPRG